MQASQLFHELGEDILGLQFYSGKAVDETNLESELIELFIELRQKFRGKKDWESSDAIRDRLNNLGIVLEDSKDGSGWRKA